VYIGDKSPDVVTRQPGPLLGEKTPRLDIRVYKIPVMLLDSTQVRRLLGVERRTCRLGV
jgi:hypothetical protein